MAQKTILCVDDSPTDLRMMQEAVAGMGHVIVTATDGEEALESVRRQKPDLVLLDIILPNLNGYQVCRQLKTAPETKSIKIILISSKSQQTDKFWGKKQGADEYVTKPYQQGELLNLVRQQLQ